MTNLSTFLDGKEWYDNTKLTGTISPCKRKAFYSHILRGGLEAGVGPGADFGTCIHGAIATYYAWWGRENESRRRALALRSLSALHETLFTGPARNSLTPKHTIESGLAIFDHYANFHLLDDTLLKPIEIELAGAVEITPLKDEPPFKPFWYIFRIDGIHERLDHGDYWVRETKTTSGGVAREITKLCLSRQPRGYLYCARQFPGVSFTGVLPDVVGVMAKTLECRREYFPKPLADSESWRRQTIHMVEDWRRIVREGTVDLGVSGTLSYDLDRFYQETGECTAYGLCSFFDLCRYGLSPATLAPFKPNTWNPLELIQAPLPDVEKSTTVEDDKIKESIKL